MTVEIEYSLPTTQIGNNWQVDMAKQIESNRGFQIRDIERELHGTTFVLCVNTTLPNQAVENMLSDIEDYLPAGSSHVETREV